MAKYEQLLAKMDVIQTNGKKIIKIHTSRHPALKFQCKLLVELHIRLLASSIAGVFNTGWVITLYQT